MTKQPRIPFSIFLPIFTLVWFIVPMIYLYLECLRYGGIYVQLLSNQLSVGFDLWVYHTFIPLSPFSWLYYAIIGIVYYRWYRLWGGFSEAIEKSAGNVPVLTNQNPPANK